MRGEARTVLIRCIVDSRLPEAVTAGMTARRSDVEWERVLSHVCIVR